MVLNLADITVTSLDMITAYGMDGSPRFVLDELQNAKIAHTQEKQDITGKGGRKLNSLKKNKAVVVSGTNGLLSAGMLEAQTGGTFVAADATPVAYVDYLTIKSNAATTTYTAAGAAGAEIEAVFVKNDVGVSVAKLEQAADAADGKFAYAPETKTLTFFADAYEDGTEVVVYYKHAVAGNVLHNESDKYSEKLELFVDGTAEDKCSRVYHIQFHMAKADFSGDFDIDLGDNQTVHAFEAESLAGSCGGSGALWDLTIFGAEIA